MNFGGKAMSEENKNGSWWRVSRQSLLIYAAAILTSVLSPTLPAVTLIGSVLTLLFIDRMPRIPGFLLFFLLVVPTFAIQQRDVIPLPDNEFYVMAIIVGVVGFIPFWLQVAAKNRLPTILVTLVYPCANVALEYAGSTGPFGSWGSLAYSPPGNLTLMQLASITGIWGISFLLCWAVSMAWWFFARRNVTDRKHGAEWIVFAVAVAAVVVFGQSRISRASKAFAQPDDGRSVACIVAPSGVDVADEVEAWQEAAQGDEEKSPAEIQSLLDASRPAVLKQFDYLMRKSKEQADAGAKLIVWSEGALITPPAFEQELLDRCCEFAKEHSTNVAMAVGVLYPNKQPQFVENKIVLINETGSIAGQYLKTKIVPGEPSMEGEGMIPVFETTFAGNIAPIVCFDADFPGYVRQISDAKDQSTLPNVLVIAANDWQAVSETHMQMSAFRAVENGVWIVRSASNGTSAVISPLGQVRARLSSFETPEPALSGWVSGDRLQTWYPTIGDGFAKASCMGLLLLIVGMIFGGQKRNAKAG